MKTERYYPSEICIDCGDKYGRSRENHAMGVWEGKCGWCDKDGTVTAPRDFLYPHWPIKQTKEESK